MFIGTLVGFSHVSVGMDTAYNSVDTGRCKFSPQVGKIPWRRVWQPTPVFLLAKSRRQRSLIGYGTWGSKESDITEATEHACTHVCMYVT